MCARPMGEPMSVPQNTICAVKALSEASTILRTYRREHPNSEHSHTHAYLVGIVQEIAELIEYDTQPMPIQWDEEEDGKYNSLRD